MQLPVLPFAHALFSIVYRRNRSILTAALLTWLTLWATPVHAATATWLASSGTWSTAGNWSGNAVPTFLDTVLIDFDRTSIVSDGVGAMAGPLITGSSGSGTLEISGGSLSNSFGYLGYAPGSFGTATVTAGTWENANDLYVGFGGTGSLEISGGTTTQGRGYVGFEAGSTGSVTVSSGTWGNAYDLYIGRKGNGRLRVTGGTVVSTYGHIAGWDTSSGTATVSAGLWKVTDFLSIADTGQGTLQVSGGTVMDDRAFLAYDSGGNATAEVTSGTWNNATGLFVGLSGSATLNLSGGLISDATASVGDSAGAHGVAFVTGGQWENTSSFFLGKSGAGMLTLSGSGALTVNSGTGTLQIAEGANSSGTLILGDGDTVGALNVGMVAGGSGTGAVKFNYNGYYVFAPRLTGPLSVQKISSGTTVFTAGNAYTGPTMIQAGRIVINGDQSTATGPFSVSSSAVLSGTGIIGGASTISGTLEPGTGLGLLTFSNNLTLTGSSTLILEIGGQTRGSEFDALTVGGTFTTGGILRLELANGYTPPIGAAFDLFQCGSIAGTFTALDLPALPDEPGMAWNTTDLYTAGVLRVVPEPSSMALALCALGFGFPRSRRSRSIW